MPGRTPGRSAWHLPASARRTICLASCSRRWPVSTWRMCRIAAADPQSRTCLVDRLTLQRQDALPQVSPMADFLPGYEAVGWWGLFAPRNTSVEIIDRLNKEINAALADPRMKARLADLGSEALPGSPADLGKLVRSDTEKWAGVIRAAHITLQ